MLHGKITSTTFTGSNVEAEVEIPTSAGGHRTLTVQLPTNQPYTAGDDVRLTLDPDYASVVRNSCEALGFRSGSTKENLLPSPTSVST